MDENYCALVISIFKGLSPEQSFELLNTGTVKRKCDPEGAIDMIKLKAEGLTFKEIGDIFGVSDQIAYSRIRRYKQREEKYEARKESYSCTKDLHKEERPQLLQLVSN